TLRSGERPVPHGRGSLGTGRPPCGLVDGARTSEEAALARARQSARRGTDGQPSTRGSAQGHEARDSGPSVGEVRDDDGEDAGADVGAEHGAHRRDDRVEAGPVGELGREAVGAVVVPHVVDRERGPGTAARGVDRDGREPLDGRGARADLLDDLDPPLAHGQERPDPEHGAEGCGGRAETAAAAEVVERVDEEHGAARVGDLDGAPRDDVGRRARGGGLRSGPGREAQSHRDGARVDHPDGHGGVGGRERRRVHRPGQLAGEVHGDDLARTGGRRRGVRLSERARRRLGRRDPVPGLEVRGHVLGGEADVLEVGLAVDHDVQRDGTEPLGGPGRERGGRVGDDVHAVVGHGRATLRRARRATHPGPAAPARRRPYDPSMADDAAQSPTELAALRAAAAQAAAEAAEARAAAAQASLEAAEAAARASEDPTGAEPSDTPADEASDEPAGGGTPEEAAPSGTGSAPEPAPEPEPEPEPESGPDGAALEGYAAEVAAGYAYKGGTLALGALLEGEVGGEPAPRADVQVGFALSMLNRHGLVAGATGTGKTKTLQGMAEGLSAAGVPVFLADVKGDLSG